MQENRDNASQHIIRGKNVTQSIINPLESTMYEKESYNSNNHFNLNETSYFLSSLLNHITKP